MKPYALLFASFFLAACSAEPPREAGQTEEAIVDRPKGQTSSMETNKRLVATFFETLTAGDDEGAFSVVDPNVAWWVPGDLPFSGTKTRAEYMGVVGAIRSGFPTGFALQVTSMIAEGDKVAAEVASSGKHRNGRTYANKYHFLITIKDGKFVAVKEYMDTLHLYKLIQP